MISTSNWSDAGQGSAGVADPDAHVDDPSEDEVADHRRGPRRRGDALIVAIFEATLAELAEVGYAELTMERVASRARASKGSLYRRWSSRAELVVDALEHERPHHREVPDTGNIRQDLLSFLGSLMSMHDSPSGEATHGLMAEVIRHPELMREVRLRFIDPTIAQVLDRLRRGVVRGEVRPSALTYRIASLGPALLRQHYLLYGAPIPESVVIEIVDEVLMPLVAV
ncbi:MAG TPA: TetR/AcrR family transcriptional regulator [Pseudonocardia sp.]|jgi:AcrR family transcriptional regulator